MKYLVSCLVRIANLCILLICLTIGLSSSAQAAIKHTNAYEAGLQSCGNLYPASDKDSKARRNLLKGGCWSCPKGFKRTALPAPDNHKSCKKRRALVNAKYDGKATGVLKNKCKGKPWLKNKKCWTCPSDFKRSLKEVNGAPQCKPKTKNYYHSAKLRGQPVCGKGTWSPLSSKKCYTCPAKYVRNPLRISSDRAKDDKACITYTLSLKKQTRFIRDHTKKAIDALTEHPDMIKQAGEFQKKIAKTIKKKGMKSLSREDIRKAGGVRLLTEACDKEYGSITLTMGADGSKVIGGNASAGFSLGLVNECDSESGQDGNDALDRNTNLHMSWLTSTNVSIGASIGGDAGINIGFWKAPYDKLHGFANGVVVGTAVQGYGANGSGWWAINWGGKKDEFVGISLGYQGGLSTEAEYNWGYTFQKGTFNVCKNVKVNATNKTGREIKVMDVDYYDYEKGLWRSEPTKNRKISNNKPYEHTFNFNQVGQAHTRIRVMYKKKKRGGGWSEVRNSRSRKVVCEDGDSYTFNIVNK